MDNRILALLVIIGVVGSVAAAQPAGDRERRNGQLEDGIRLVDLVGQPRAKRAVGDTYGESKNSNRTESTSPPLTSTTTQSTPEPIITPTPKPTTTSTTLTTKPNPPETTLTTKPTSAEITPSMKPSTAETTVTTKPPTPETSPKTPSSPETTPSTKPNSAEMTTEPKPKTTASQPPKPTPAPPAGCPPNSQKPSAPGNPSTSPCEMPGLQSRSNFDSDPKEPNEVQRQPPHQNPGYGPGPMYNAGYNPYGYPAFNSIPGAGNFAWTRTNNFPGSASSSASSSSSSSGYGGGMVFPDPVMPFVNTRGGFVDNHPNYPSYGGNGIGPSGFAFPQNFDFDPDPFHIQEKMDEHFRQLQKQFEIQQRSFLDTSNSLGQGGGSAPGGSSAFSSIQVGPRGGFQTGMISPVAPGIESRFAENVPAPGGNYGVFASSSSSSGVGADGKQFSHKSATTGVNDNGKISFRTVKD